MGAGAISAGVVKRSGKNWGRTHWGRTISREPLGGSPSRATSTTIYLGHSFFLSGASGTTLPYPLSPITLLPSYSLTCTPCITCTIPGAKMHKQHSESKLSRLLHSGLANCNQYGADPDLWTDLNLAHYTGNRVVRIRRAQALGKSLCADCPMLRLCAEMATEPQSAAWQGVILAGVPVLGEDRTQQYKVAMESIRMVAAGESVDAAHRHQETYYLDQLMKAQLTIKKNGNLPKTYS